MGKDLEVLGKGKKKFMLIMLFSYRIYLRNGLLVVRQ